MQRYFDAQDREWKKKNLGRFMEWVGMKDPTAKEMMDPFVWFATQSSLDQSFGSTSSGLPYYGTFSSTLTTPTIEAPTVPKSFSSARDFISALVAAVETEEETKGKSRVVEVEEEAKAKPAEDATRTVRWADQDLERGLDLPDPEEEVENNLVLVAAAVLATATAVGLIVGLLGFLTLKRRPIYLFIPALGLPAFLLTIGACRLVWRLSGRILLLN